MTYQIPITQADLQAYTDGQLSAARQREVEAYLKNNPDAAAMVEHDRKINDAIHEYFDPVLEEPVPAQLIPNQYKATFYKRHMKILRVAATICWLTLGGVIGWQLHPVATGVTYTDNLTTQLAEPAAFAHAIYSPEVRHPVEVAGDEQQHLVKWLSKRLHTKVNIPNLSQHGFELVGGRLLPSIDRMAAQFMYQRDDGVRVTLYNRGGVWDNKQTSFQFTKQHDSAVFYWIDGPLGFALVGNLSRTELFELSKSVYQQLN